MSNTGHGHVTSRDDGFKARCGGPMLCAVCAREMLNKTKVLEILTQHGTITFNASQLADVIVAQHLGIDVIAEICDRMGVHLVVDHVGDLHIDSPTPGANPQSQFIFDTLLTPRMAERIKKELPNEKWHTYCLTVRKTTDNALLVDNETLSENP